MASTVPILFIFSVTFELTGLVDSCYIREEKECSNA